MLLDIGAAEGIAAISTEDPLAAPAFVVPAVVRAVVKSRIREELLVRLNAALTARFRGVSPQMLEHHLLSPLKKAVGNAFKHGNGSHPDKEVTVEIIVTARGAFLEVSDQGDGFDVPATVARLMSGDKYYENAGSGFRRFAKTDTVISFANGGRTFRACFLAVPLRALDQHVG